MKDIVRNCLFFNFSKRQMYKIKGNVKNKIIKTQKSVINKKEFFHYVGKIMVIMRIW